MAVKVSASPPQAAIRVTKIVRCAGNGGVTTGSGPAIPTTGRIFPRGSR